MPREISVLERALARSLGFLLLAPGLRSRPRTGQEQMRPAGRRADRKTCAAMENLYAW